MNGVPAGKVQTVLGLIDAEHLGVTLMHEHLLHDMTVYFREPAEAGERKRAHEPVTLENLSWVRRNDSSSLDNIRLTSERLATDEMMLYKLNGGDSVVELTTAHVFGRDPMGLARIARAAGLHIIMGTGYDFSSLNEPGLVNKTVEEIAEPMIQDILHGAGPAKIRAGIIGEIGCSSLDECERKVLRACAVAQRETHTAISVHPSPTDELVLEIAGILKDAGAEPAHTVIGHVDVVGYRDDTCRKLLDEGFYLGFDNFGFEGRINLPGIGHSVQLSDDARLRRIVHFVQLGYENQLVLSQDIATKVRTESYGGHGYAHILRDIVPLLRENGLTDGQIQTLLADNPKRVLSWSSKSCG